MTGMQGDQLAATLNILRTKIQQIRERNDSMGEENTKAVLIEPILSALGWDVLDIEQVKREYKLKQGDNPVDYALFILRDPRLFLEAKGLEQDIEDRKWISQTVNYANNAGVEWCVLTNGDEYRIYNTHAAVELEEKLYQVVAVSKQDQAGETKQTLDLLSKDKIGNNVLHAQWREYSIDRDIQRALEGLVSLQDNSLIRLLRKKTNLKRQDIRDSLSRLHIRVDFPSAAGVRPLGSLDQTVRRREPPRTPKASPRTGGRHGRASVKLVLLIQAGLFTPPLEIEKHYKGVTLKATIQQDGSVLFDGNSYDSLSTAAGMARKTVIGAPAGHKYPQTNGWIFWRYRDPHSGELKDTDCLRRQYLRKG